MVWPVCCCRSSPCSSRSPSRRMLRPLITCDTAPFNGGGALWQPPPQRCKSFTGASSAIIRCRSRDAHDALMPICLALCCCTQRARILNQVDVCGFLLSFDHHDLHGLGAVPQLLQIGHVHHAVARLSRCHHRADLELCVVLCDCTWWQWSVG